MRYPQQFTENTAIHYERDDVTVDIIVARDAIYTSRSNIPGWQHPIQRRHIVAEVNGFTIALVAHLDASKQGVLDELATRWANSSLTKDESLALYDVDVMGPELVETNYEKELF